MTIQESTAEKYDGYGIKNVGTASFRALIQDMRYNPEVLVAKTDHESDRNENARCSTVHGRY